MSTIDGVFSIRLVVADFYMEKPTFGLDPCYSEFRGKEIKRVPIIRIFGANAIGQKTCMHVHGVFPYFYIPYEHKEFDSLQRAIYQIAINLDKAINVSLGQASSAAQHVFKIQLVKGIPFYGYHRREHQYLKIYMFNPRFVRRAANLLQNGAIINKIFHPHESHVPYLLQFMIDYNLYGMSFLHVPFEIVKFRKCNEDDEIPFTNVQSGQILETFTIKKQSCSALEVDISSNFILNRFQLLNKSSSSTQANPGIESIWLDERMRRNKLMETYKNDEEKRNTIPALEVPETQDRPNIEIAESEHFYRAGLLSRLMVLENSLSSSGTLADQSVDSTMQSNITHTTLNITNPTAKEQRRTFNLSKLLTNAVYPEECTQEDQLVNASFIENHLTVNRMFQNTTPNESIQQSDKSDNNPCRESEQSDDIFLDDTIVDEKLVLSLTQPHVPLDATLRQEDMELLDVLQQLEEHNEDDNHIDLDSSLAPLSQRHNNFDQSPELLDKETAAAAVNQPVSDNESESDNESGGNLHDYSIILDDMDELLLKLTQSQPTQEIVKKLDLPQIDGSDDLLPRTPKKNSATRKSTNSSTSNQKTPPRTPTTPKQHKSKPSPTRLQRTPKSNVALKYRPLPLLITNKSAQKNLSIEVSSNTTMPTKTLLTSLDLDNQSKSSITSLRKKLAMSEMRRKSISVTNEFRAQEEILNSKTPLRRSRRTRDLDKTHIACSLMPRRKSERGLKAYTPNKEEMNVVNQKNSVDVVIPLDTRTDELGTSNIDDCFTPIINKRRTRTRNHAVPEAKEVEVPKTSFVSEKSQKIVNTTEIIDEQPANSSSYNGKKLRVRIKRLKTLENISNESATSNVSNNKAEIVVDNREKYMKNKSDEQSLQQNHSEKVIVAAQPDESEEEIQASDNECELSRAKLRKTPNLKRLSRSFRDRLKIKRNNSILETPGNSSKFEQKLELGINNSESSNLSQHTTPKSTDIINFETETTTPITMKSFYEHSFALNSPSIFSDCDVNSPVLAANGYLPATGTIESSGSNTSWHRLKSAGNTPIVHTMHSTSSRSTNSGLPTTVIITPLDQPPTYDEVLAGCRKFDIMEYEFQQPYYSNPDDLTKQKEVGHTLLQIPGNKLNDCIEFESLLSDEGLTGLTGWRRKQLLAIGGPAMLNRYRNAQLIREYFATAKHVTITPHESAPSKQDAKLWLKARELLKNKEELEQLDKDVRVDSCEDSPIKIKRQKVTMMLNTEGSGDGECNSAGSDDETDRLSRSLSLTPMTPGTSNISKLNDKADKSFTPLSTLQSAKNSSVLKSALHSNKRRRLSLRRSKVSLNEKLKAVAEIKYNAIEPKLNADSNELETGQSSLKSSQTSETSSISSQTALAQLEHSSFVQQLHSDPTSSHDVSFGLTNATLDNTFGFKVNLENLQQAKADIEYNYLTTITLELFVPTREDFYPNPEQDEMRCLFYAIEHSIPPMDTAVSQTPQLPTKACGYIIVNDLNRDFVEEGRRHGIDADIDVKIVHTEVEAFEALLELCARWDPDIFAGYEIEMGSWGYVIERAKYLCFNIAPLLSRVPTQKMRDFVDEDRDQFTELDIEMKICGRIMLDVWRLMRSEIALTSYTFENVMYHILHKRCPAHNFRSLTKWFESPCSRWIVIEYYLERVRGTMTLLEQLDLIGRTSEMAKLIGIQFYEVLSRGSQFRVESMMLRIAKPKNIVPLSPSVQQRAHMRAPEYLALIMEPQSRFYADPLIVLDFQSLYPSMIIAYNYCFSTCLGRVEHLGQTAPFEFGASQLRVSPKMLKKLIDKDLVTISPCGVVFVKSSVREGILPRMLTEILNTRQMVKQSMKVHKNNSALQRILHSRQLGLKLMANVTYGYTAANFSGRMPSVEVGDTVVSKGRETLERAIKMVETNDKWNVRVVYGDTDSMFVLVPGRNRAQAFKIGEEIAEAVTNINPHPVKLKLEKVYQPCILQTKKRYVGYMYETADQTEPVYEAKGIETVRRDGCPAVAKMLEKVLRILFETADVSQVKQYVCRQFTKLLSGRANIQDLIFAKEFRGLNGYKPTACVPALELTRKWMQSDPRHIPRRGERVPYIVTNGPPGVPLIRLIRSPHDVLADEGLKINAIYYITKAIIPPLNRCLLLIGADVNEWFTNLPRKILFTPALSTANEIMAKPSSLLSKKSTISQYFSTTNCIIDCGRQTKRGVCDECSKNATKAFVTLRSKIGKIERSYHLTQHICQACCGRVGDLNCASLDCPVLYVLEVKRRDLQQTKHFSNLLEERF